LVYFKMESLSLARKGSVTPNEKPCQHFSTWALKPRPSIKVQENFNRGPMCLGFLRAWPPVGMLSLAWKASSCASCCSKAYSQFHLSHHHILTKPPQPLKVKLALQKIFFSIRLRSPLIAPYPMIPSTMCIIHSKDTISKPLFSTSPTKDRKCKLFDSLQCLRELRYTSPPAQSPWIFLEGPSLKAHVENLWWSCCKVYSGPISTYRAVAIGWCGHVLMHSLMYCRRIKELAFSIFSG
jgi:hypothetical protein